MARVLVVDDSASVREALRRVLKRDGHSVLEASEGREALGILRREDIQLALVDVFLPEIDGAKVVVRMRERFPGTKLVAMSGGGRSEREAAAESGVSAVLRKPFGLDQLLEAVRAALQEAR